RDRAECGTRCLDDPSKEQSRVGHTSVGDRREPVSVVVSIRRLLPILVRYRGATASRIVAKHSYRGIRDAYVVQPSLGNLRKYLFVALTSPRFRANCGSR